MSSSQNVILDLKHRNNAITLVPWDPESPEHVETLYAQRVEASWNEDKIEEWQKQHCTGEIYMYWAAVESGSEGSQATPAHHVLIDSATQLGGRPRQPSDPPRRFFPAGHVLLRPKKFDSVPDCDEKDVIYSIHSLFVSSSIQSTGLGGATLKAVEEMASRPPHKATELVLYTIDREANMSEGRYASRGQEVPKVILQDWYERKGYRVYKRIPGFFNFEDSTGKLWEADEIYMKKRVT